jgi:uncharacterized protein YwbE
VSLRGLRAGRCGRGVSRPLLCALESFPRDGGRKLRLIEGEVGRVSNGE